MAGSQLSPLVRRCGADMASIEKRDTGDGVSYRVKIRVKGRPPQSATFERLTDARRWAQSTEAAIRERRYFKTTEAQRRTLGELVDRYIRDVVPQKGTWAGDQAKQLRWWRAELGRLMLSDVTPAVIAEARDKLAAGITVRGRQRSPATVNRYLAVLSHAFTLAVKEWGWLDDNPSRKVSKPREPRGRVRYLSDDERAPAARTMPQERIARPVPVLIIRTFRIKHDELSRSEARRGQG